MEMERQEAEPEPEGSVAIMGRAEIDTRAPFSSVKEAVRLFGERVLAGQIYANNLKEIRGGPRHVALTTELEETKQSLEKAKEEGKLMAQCMRSLKQELEQTSKELKSMKVWKQDMEEGEIEKKRYVKFASSPALAKVMVTREESPPNNSNDKVKKKKKPVLIPLVAWLFHKKKGSLEAESPRK